MISQISHPLFNFVLKGQSINQTQKFEVLKPTYKFENVIRIAKVEDSTEDVVYVDEAIKVSSATKQTLREIENFWRRARLMCGITAFSAFNISTVVLTALVTNVLPKSYLTLAATCTAFALFFFKRASKADRNLKEIELMLALHKSSNIVAKPYAEFRQKSNWPHDNPIKWYMVRSQNDLQILPLHPEEIKFLWFQNMIDLKKYFSDVWPTGTLTDATLNKLFDFMIGFFDRLSPLDPSSIEWAFGKDGAIKCEDTKHTLEKSVWETLQKEYADLSVEYKKLQKDKPPYVMTDGPASIKKQNDYERLHYPDFLDKITTFFKKFPYKYEPFYID